MLSLTPKIVSDEGDNHIHNRSKLVYQKVYRG